MDSYIKWRIVDPKLYYISVGGDESRAKTRLNQTVNAGLREEFGKRTVHDVVSGERDKIMEQMREKADSDARKIGVQIVDVRVKRVELPTEVSDAVYRRMEAERKRVANELRSEGSAEAEKFVPMPTGSAKSSLPRPIVTPRRSRVKAMPRQPVPMPRPLARIPSSTLSIAVSRPIEAVLETRTISWLSSRIPNSSST